MEEFKRNSIIPARCSSSLQLLVTEKLSVQVEASKRPSFLFAFTVDRSNNFCARHHPSGTLDVDAYRFSNSTGARHVLGTRRGGGTTPFLACKKPTAGSNYVELRRECRTVIDIPMTAGYIPQRRLSGNIHHRLPVRSRRHKRHRVLSNFCPSLGDKQSQMLPAIRYKIYPERRIANTGENDAPSADRCSGDHKISVSRGEFSFEILRSLQALVYV